MTKPHLPYLGGSPFGLDRRTRAEVRNAVSRYTRTISESAATLDRAPERTTVREATLGGATTAGPGRMLLRLIKAGVSLNGNAYPANVLREAAQTKAWAKGTRAYIDHAPPEEEEKHPSGSVKNLAAVLTEDARWDEASQSLIAEARLFEPWRGPLTEMAEAGAIGMSIRAWVSGAPGQYEGREAFVVERIEGGRSVDFVTVPAAGGEVISVLEAVGHTPVVEAANLGAWLESRLHLVLTQYADDMYGDGRLTRDERIVLSAAIGDGLTAWTARVEAEAPQLFQRDRWSEPPEPVAADMAEATAESTAEPDGTPEDVTTGEAPAVPATPPEESEDPVSGIQTGAPPEQAGTATVPGNESTQTTEVQAQPVAAVPDIAAIVAEAVRAATGPLTQTIADLSARESARDAALRDARNRDAASEAATTALAATEHADVRESIRGRVVSRVTSAVPTTTEGAVDHAALGELVTAVIADEATHVRRERANALAEAGVGMPYGMGGARVEESPEDDGLDGVLENFFSDSLGLTTEQAKIAAKGR